MAHLHPSSLALGLIMLAWLPPFQALAERPAPPRPPELALPAGTKELAPDEVTQLLLQGQVNILDVRTPDEVSATGHLPEARFVDFFSSEFEKGVQRLGFDKARPCLVYCALGGRSKRAAAQLHSLDFKAIFIIKDGYEHYRRSQSAPPPR